MPEGLDSHHDASAHVPLCHSQIMTRSLCSMHFQLLSDQEHVPFLLFLFFTNYFILHMSALAGTPTTAWGLGCRRKRRCIWKKGENKVFSRANVNAWTASETDILILSKRSCAVSFTVAPSYPSYITDSWNKGNFSSKQPAEQLKTARSVCPEAGPEQQLLITEALESVALARRPLGAGCSEPAPTPGEHATPAVSVCVCVCVCRCLKHTKKSGS